MTTETPILTPAETAFVKRMAYHVQCGLSFEDAARAVIADDERLFAALCDRASASYVPTPDERGLSYTGPERPGDVIRREMARDVYRRLRPRP